MNDLARQLRDFFVSLKLTLVLLVLSMVLVFAATLDQVNLGIWAVQEKYFHALFVFVRVGDVPLPVFPGGYLIGGFLLVNLVAAHFCRLTLTWRKSGLWLTHAGLILLLVGELLSGLLQQEYQLRLTEGETKNYSESSRRNELALIETTDPKFDDVVAIPEELLARQSEFQHPKLPFRVVVRAYFPNAALQLRNGAPGEPPSPATAGIGRKLIVVPVPLTAKQDEVNAPAAFLELIGADGSLGTWAVTTQVAPSQVVTYAGRSWRLGLRPERTYRPFSLTLKKVRHDVYPGTDIPKNFSSLVQLTTPDGRENREVLIYMNNPLRFAGLTFYQHQMDAAHNTSVLQVVRNPSWLLPYLSCALITLGLCLQFCLHLVAFFRRRAAAPVSSPDKAASSRVQAPRALAVSDSFRLFRFLPPLVLLAALASVVASLLPPRNHDDFDLVAFGRLPVLVNGRIKPLDTVARTHLLILQGRQRVSDPATPEPFVATPTQWLADVLFNPTKADTYPTFRVSATDSPELLQLLGLTEEITTVKYDSALLRTLAMADFVPKARTRFSYRQIEPKLDELDRQAKLADPIEEKLRTPFQRAVIQLRDRVIVYQRLKHSVQVPDSPDFLTELSRFEAALPAGVEAVRARQQGQPHDETAFKVMIDMAGRYEAMGNLANLLAIPPAASETNLTAWKTAGAALLETFGTGRLDANVMAYAGLGHAWRAHQPVQFNEIVRLYRAELARRFDAPLHKSDVETRFNAAAPFYQSMTLYAAAFFLAIFSWLKWPDVLGRSAFHLVAVALALTTAGILTRMWLESRPPVTNLYSSALFVGWVAVALCLILEKTYRNAIGAAAAGVIGFATLLIAHHLSLSGDTMEMMRAVLDTNLWLATHVVVVTTGYGATFLAGFLALIYIVRGVFTTSLDRASADSLARMVYGIVCFATLCSFTGTVLGGIWADQSWGRFWGWDPKENGALLIVIWNAIILHARWGGYIRQRGLMILAVFGNIVTSWSWFGTNMLGVGLHSYGFTDAAFVGLAVFIASQLILIILANLPLSRWRSFRTP